MKTNFLLILLLLTMLYLPGFGQARHQFRHLTMQEGLSHNNVNCIMQDSKGFLWFGTQDGLGIFDGYTVKTYIADAEDMNSISDNFIKSIAEDADGYIWVATNRGLNRFDRKTEQFKHYFHDPAKENSLPHDAISVVFCDAKKNIWIGTDLDRLCRYDPATDSFIRYANVTPNDGKGSNTAILCLSETSDEKLLIGTHSGLSIYDYKTNAFSYITKNTPDVPLLNNSVYSVIEDKDKNLWVGTGNGLALLTERRTKVKYFVPEPNNSNGLANGTIRALAQDRSGKIWIATMNGLDLFDPKSEDQRFLHYVYAEGNKNSISSNEAWSLYNDRQHVMWVGTFGGGVNFTDASEQDFRLYAHDPQQPTSISHSSVLSFLEDSKGRFWIGTDGGGLNLFNKATDTFKSFQHDGSNPNTLTFNTVLAIAEDTQGQLWLGTWANGVDRFDLEKNTFKHYNIESSNISNNSVWTILNDSNGNLWLGTIGGGINRYDPKTDSFVHYAKDWNAPDKSKLASVLVWYLYEDSKKRIWAGTNDGLALYDPKTDSFKMYVSDPKNSKSLSNNWVVCVFEDSKGNIWVCTHGGGLNLFDPKTETFTVYKERNGLPNNIVMGIVEDGQGNLWLSTINSICKFIPPSAAGEAAQFINYDQSHGLQPKQFNLGSIHKSSDGKIYIGGKGGFNVFHPESVKGNLYKPPIVITDFRIFDLYVPIGRNSPLKMAINEADEIVVHYEQSVLAFDFAALNYVVPEQNQYAYKLEGFDKNWNMAGTKRSATYTNLDPGTYTLYIKASNNDGLWNDEPKTIRIKVIPPWWWTWWAYCLYAVLSVAAVMGIVKWNSKRLERDKARLERMVQIRTKEVSQQKEEIQIKNEELQASSEEIYQQKEEIEAIADNLKEANKEIQQSYTDIRVLGEIGQKVTASLDPSVIIAMVYENVALMMPAECFGIGLYMPAYHDLLFQGFIEKGEILPTHKDSLHKDHLTLSGLCFLGQKDIYIADAQMQQSYEGITLTASVGEMPQSILYLPLIIEGRGIGVITVQSFSSNAYTAKHIEVLKTLASYIAIALENANSYDIIKEKNNHITDSLRYARTIQQAILPADKQIGKFFSNYFVFYQPKDIVSGDFYWFSHVEIDGRVFNFLAVVDCTGHGVPGAFMSMIGFSVLNEIVKEKKIIEPAQILEQLDLGIRTALRQDEKANEDGMDVALVRIEKLPGKTLLVSAGAKRSTYLCRNGEMEKIQSVKRSIGGHQLKEKEFEQHETELAENAMLYLFTDGFGDQANPDGKRFGSTMLLEMLLKNASQSCEAQESVLREAFVSFKGDARQRDDVTVIGVEISVD